MTFLKYLLSKAAQGGPTPLFPPLMKDPRPPRFLFIFGSGPEGLFFSRGDFENQPTDKSVAQVTHSLPLAQIKWDELKKNKLFYLFRAQRNQILSRQKGGLLTIQEWILFLSRAPERKKGGGTRVVTIGKIQK